MIKVRWAIEYWNNNSKKVECFKSEEGTWEEAPKKSVIYVYITTTGISRRYGDPASAYTWHLLGTDFYYFYQRNGLVIFGGWNDETTGPTTTNAASHRLIWHPDGRCEKKLIQGRPEGIPDKAVKEGVWVEEPWASELGLSEKESGPRVVSEGGSACPIGSV